jgi:anti-sigma factor RsiW
MNCSDWEERIALYAGGDLPPAEAAAVERHVAECAGCQMLLGGLRASLEFVREAHGEPLEAAHFAAVRARVLAEIERGRGPRWGLAWGFALAVAAAVLLVAVWTRPPKSMVLPMPPAPAAPLVAQAVRAPAAVPARRRRPPRQVMVKADQPAEPMVVKLLTDDPDVIIYWITETKGE